MGSGKQFSPQQAVLPSSSIVLQLPILLNSNKTSNRFSSSFAVPSAGLSSASISPALEKPSAKKPLLPSKAEEFASTSSTSLELNDTKYCRLCCAPFDNLFSAQQHYVGKKHRRNIARKKIMEELGDEALLAEVRINGKQNVSKWGQLE